MQNATPKKLLGELTDAPDQLYWKQNDKHCQWVMAAWNACCPTPFSLQLREQPLFLMG